MFSIVARACFAALASLVASFMEYQSGGQTYSFCRKGCISLHFKSGQQACFCSEQLPSYKPSGRHCWSRARGLRFSLQFLLSLDSTKLETTNSRQVTKNIPWAILSISRGRCAGALMEVRSLFGLNSAVFEKRLKDGRTDPRTKPLIKSLVRD